MPTDAPTPQAMEMFNLIDWMKQHPQAVLCIAGFFLWVSLSLIICMWLTHRQAPLLKKLVWSFVLLIPLFGWIAYGGWFSMPETQMSPCPASQGGGV